MLNSVDSIINSYQHKNFSGEWLVVASWENLQSPTSNNVNRQYTDTIFNQNIPFLSKQNNIFQGILVTDFVTSYVVATYKCGDLTHSDPGDVYYTYPSLNLTDFHDSTYREDSYRLACLNEPESPWVNLVIELTLQSKCINCLDHLQ